VKHAKNQQPIAPENPAIEFTANVRAKELRFDEVPDTEVHPPAQTERENLPKEVRPADAGTTFRNVSVRLRIASELTADEPGHGEGSREGETKRYMLRRGSGSPSQGARDSQPARKEQE
jgi:hypothetical protein